MFNHVTQLANWRWLIVLFPVLLPLSNASAECTINRYLSPTGSDTNPGTIALPWQTLGYAVSQVRQINQTDDICVYLREGTFTLPRTVTLTQADSGRNGHMIIYSAYPGEVPRLRGGQALTGWILNGDRYQMTLTAQQVSDLCDANPPTEAARRCFRQLYVSGERATRARWPNLGQLMPSAPSEPAPRSYGRIAGWVPGSPGAISVKSSDLPSPLPTVWTGLELVVQMYWASNVVRIAAAAPSCGQGLTCLTPEGNEENALFHSGWQWPARNPSLPYHFESALWLLDAPGEWYVERPGEAGSNTDASVYYKPRVGETIDSTTELIAPRLDSLIAITGAAGCSSLTDCVHSVVFTGITFEYSGWLGPNQFGYLEHPYLSQWWGPSPKDRSPAAIHIENARDVHIERNTLQHLGGSGIDARLNVQGTEIVGNVLRDVADAGITLGQLGEYLGTAAVPDGVTVSNNDVSYTGQDYRGGAGIVIANAKNSVVEHNHISHSPYTGMNVGWGLENASAWPDNVIQYNHIHNVLELLIDGGGIYIQGDGLEGHETIIKKNYIHDIVRSRMSHPLGGCAPGVNDSPTVAIYADQGTREMSATGNVLLDARQCAGSCIPVDPAGGPGCATNDPPTDTGSVWFHCCVDLNADPADFPEDNGGEHGAVKTASGLEAAYKSIAPSTTVGSFVTRFSLGTIRNDHPGRVGFKIRWAAET